tara:strand:+ start:177 stop:413 length:237 start_codon:yes stop_codon:yes gene_type:complete
MFTVSYSIDYMDTNPIKQSFETLDQAHEWVHDEVSRRVAHIVEHSVYQLSETDVQDLEATEYSLISISDGVVTEFMCI